MEPSLSPTLAAMLSRALPPLLYHYTSPAGLIGIITPKAVWATNVAHLNDTKEIQFAADYAKDIIIEKYLKAATSADETALLLRMSEMAGTAARRYYVFSITEAGDLLSQWRAYCPLEGGYAIGFPSTHLRIMASQQGFSLWPCIYGSPASKIVSEIIDTFIGHYGNMRGSGVAADDARKQTAADFAQWVARYGAAMKAGAFHEEREWRLVSGLTNEDHPQVEYRAGKRGIVPFYTFRLVLNQA